MTSVNFWPILVASVAAFAIGSLWYSPVLFGRQWMTLSGITDADIAASSTKGMWKFYVIQFISTLVTFSILAFIIAAVGGQTAGDGIFFAVLAWIAFPAMGSVSGILWEKKPIKLVLINTLSTLVCWIVAGAIIGSWK